MTFELGTAKATISYYPQQDVEKILSTEGAQLWEAIFVLKKTDVCDVWNVLLVYTRMSRIENDKMELLHQQVCLCV